MVLQEVDAVAFKLAIIEIAANINQEITQTLTFVNRVHELHNNFPSSLSLKIIGIV